jgi:uncharacterized protein YaiL (DUF2058 family)
MTSIDYIYIDIILNEAKKAGISQTLIEQYAEYYIAKNKIDTKEAYRLAIEELKKERGIFNELGKQ